MLGSNAEGTVGVVNLCTTVVGTRPVRAVRTSFRDTFLEHFAAVRAYRETRTEVGFMAAVIDPEGSLRQLVTLSAPREGRHGSMCSFGRHTHVDVHLADDPSVGLRHFVTRVFLDERGAPQLRLYDLRTPLGLDVDGVGRCEALGVEGDVFVRVGSYAVMFFPLAPQRAPWPVDALTAWESRPSAEVLDTREHSVPEHRVTARPRLGDEDVTRVTVLESVVETQSTTAETELTGEMSHVLAVYTARGRTLVGLRASDLERGVLVGRYERCDEFSLLLSEAYDVSRVHLLVFALGDEIVAFDVGSSFGTALDDDPVRFFAWEVGSIVQLASGAALRLGRVVDSEAVFPVVPVDWSQN